MTSEIYNVDCLEYMRTLPDNAFDLAVVDPPYGINAGKMTMGIGTRRTYSRGKDWDAGVPGPEYFEQLFRVAREQIIWGGNYFQLPLSEDWIVWDKMNYGRSFSEAEFAWCSIHRKIRVFRFRTTTPVEGGKIHPTQKPVELLRYLVRTYTNEGDIILDNCIGSGTTAVACIKEKRHFIGFELNKEYFEKACKRIENERKQLKLF